MKQIIFHPSAKLELAEARNYHDEKVAGLGQRFLQAVDKAIKEIQANPKRGEGFRRTVCRSWLVRRFRYVVYYRETADSILIVAVAHGSRRPGYWRRRLLG